MRKNSLVISFLSVVSLFATASAATTDSSFYTSFDKTKIYYEVHGKGYPVVLAHGFIADGMSWKKGELFTALQAAGFQVIILDMRGNGRSDKPHDATAYANDAEAKDIMGLVAHLKLKAYDILGYSRGSIITARLLVLDKRIHKAVMGGMGTDFTDPEWPRRKMFYRALIGDTVKELEAMVRNVQKSGLDQLALAYLQKEQPSTAKETLATVKQPVLVICGDQDSDNGKAADLAAIFPHSSYVEVPGDHGGAVRTKEFAEAVVKFLRKK